MSDFQAPYAEVEQVEFAVFSDEDHLRLGVDINNFEHFGAGNLPVPGGVYDPRMGTTDHHYACATCELGKKDDPGHPGVLRLRAPEPGPLWIDEIRRWARVVCLECGAPIHPPERFAGVAASRRLNEAAQVATDGVRCRECGVVHPKIVKADDDRFSFYAEAPAPAGGADDRAARQTRLYPWKLRESFERVTEATVRALGRPARSHPQKLILTAIRILETTARPGVRLLGGSGASGGSSSYHDTTNMIQYIVKQNLRLPEIIPEPVTPEAAKLYQTAGELYFTMVKGSASASPTQGAQGKRAIVVGGRQFRSIVQSLPRKEGRIRRNLLGKRIWKIARSTISGNPLLRPDEVGLPVHFARQLQVAETVREFNRSRLMTYFLNGRGKYPGCTRVKKRASGEVHGADGLRRDFRLEVGDVIYRDIITGDIAYFNRQPSLERTSVGAHRVVVLEDGDLRPFQMNVISCSSYGADFDGDQMNLWLPHSEMGRVEAEVLSDFSNGFISTKHSAPVNGQIQDSLIGSFQLARASTVLSKRWAMDLFGGARVALPDFSDSLPGGYPGRELISRLFRQTPFNLERQTKWFDPAFAPYVDYDPAETHVVIRRGELVRGVLDNETVKAGARGGIFHLIAREYGPKRALDMVFALQQMTIANLAVRGFTVGTADMVLTPEATEEVRRIVAGVLRDSEEITAQLVRGQIVPPIGSTVHDFYEKKQIAALAISDEILKPVLESIDPETNGLFQMIATGSKGKKPNLIHIMAVIGQILINGERLKEQFAFRRTSPYFPRFATDPRAYGFVANNYISGMESAEFIASDMNGRFDLINKALSTATTGYQNRKSIMALQSDIVDHYRRVTKNSRVVQTLYGGDGLDTRRVERVRFRTVALSDAELRAGYRLDLGALPGGGAAEPAPGGGLEEAQAVFDAELEQLRRDRDYYREAFLVFADLDFADPFSDARQMPIDVGRLVRDVLAAGEGGGGTRDAATLLEMHRRVLRFAEGLPYTFLNEIQRRRRAPLGGQVRAASALLQILVRAELCGRVLASLTPPQLEYCLGVVALKFAAALIDPGTTAGILAAQAVSEFFTQYMLDSHHRSVGEGTNKAGLIRPQEIFGAKPPAAEQSAEMLLRLAPEVERDPELARLAANQIEHMTFVRFLARSQVLLEPYGDPQYPAFAEDQAWVAEFERHHPLLSPPADLSPWCSRFEIDKPMLVLKSMSLEAIAERLRKAFEKDTYIVHTPENVPQIVLRVYYRYGLFSKRSGGAGGEEKRVREAHRELVGTAIRGIEGIRSAKAVEIKRHRVDPASGALVVDGAGEKLYAIRTEGSNIYRALLHKNVDPLRVVSSSIGETARIFGRVAARGAIQREIRRLMGSGASNPRHLMLYADEMTQVRGVTSLEKGGVAVREQSNILLRMAHSSPVQVVQEAALMARRSPVYGVSAPLMLGTVPRVGSLYSEVAMDADFVRANSRSVDDLLDAL